MTTRSAFQPARQADLKLAHDTAFEKPHPSALAVMDALAAAGSARGSLSAIRQHHLRTRRPFLAPLEPAHSVFKIEGAPGVPRMTVIRPAVYETAKQLPGLVFLHGGGWTLGAYETYEPLLRQLANATGSIVIWVDYRLSPEHPYPAAFDDTRAALRWVHDNALRLGVDKSRIMLGGDSAGGNLAAAVCLAECREKSGYQPWRQILLYPCLDMTAQQASHRQFADGYLLTADIYARYRANYTAGAKDLRHWRLSPLFADNVSGLPPAVILYAGFDPLRDEAAAYALKLTLADVEVRTLYFPDMIHGFLTMGGAIPAAGAAVLRVAQALDDFAFEAAAGAFAK